MVFNRLPKASFEIEIEVSCKWFWTESCTSHFVYREHSYIVVVAFTEALTDPFASNVESESSRTSPLAS